MPLRLFAGMTPDDRIFERLLPLLPNASIVPWLPPEPGEPIRSYAQRLVGVLATSSPCFVAGVSFGGIVALEVARLLPARGCFLISSIRSPSELPPWFRAWRRLRPRHIESLLASVGYVSTVVPNRVRTPSTIRMTKLAGERGAWHRWATAAVLQWTPNQDPGGPAIIQIHGDADWTFPIRYTHPDYIIRDGGHVLPLSHPHELAQFLIEAMNASSTETAA